MKPEDAPKKIRWTKPGLKKMDTLNFAAEGQEACSTGNGHSSCSFGYNAIGCAEGNSAFGCGAVGNFATSCSGGGSGGA